MNENECDIDRYNIIRYRNKIDLFHRILFVAQKNTYKKLRLV